MEKIEMKTHEQFQLTVYRDKVLFIVLADLLTAMQVKLIEDVIQYIKNDMNWGSSIKEMELPGIGKKEVIQITKAMGLIYWLPKVSVSPLSRWFVFTCLEVLLETYLEFFDWKLKEIEKQTQNYLDAVELREKCSEDIINQQSLLIEKLKQL